MATPPAISSGRYRSAAAHYLPGRPAYAARLVRRVSQLVGLAAGDRVLDLGCGPGMLAAAFAPAVAEVVAMDPEPEMLRVATKTFGHLGNIRFVRGSSDDLSAELGAFRLVVMGRSFHWMDRPATLRRLDALIVTGGAVALFDTELRNEIPDNAWYSQFRALLARFGQQDPASVRRRTGGWSRHEAVLLDSTFSWLEGVIAIERRQVSVSQLVHRALSLSSVVPERVGDITAHLEREIEELFQAVAPRGLLTEVVESSALVARRDDDDHV